MAKNVKVIQATSPILSAQSQICVKKRRVAAYARVSTEKDEQQNSYEAQIEYYTRYIKSNPEWIFVDIYSDEGITGTSIKRRDGFNKMIEDALAGKIDLIVTKSVSRFARNTVDSLTTVRKLKDKGVEVYFEKENIFTLDSKGELLITIMSSLAQEESRSISENTTWGQRKRFADGIMSLGYSTFLGYKKGANPGDMEIVEEEAVIVRRIYDEYLAGKSPGEIAKRLTAEGIPTPAKKTRWHTSTIISILHNEKYRGDAKLQKCFTTSFLDHKMQKNTGQLPIFYVSENHPAIIKPEVFEMVQEEFRRREAAGGRAQCVSIFSGRIVCGDCGCFYGRKKWHSDTKYVSWRWHCNNKFMKREHCQTPTLKEQSLEECFVAAFNSILARKEEIAANYAECLDAITDDSALKARTARLDEVIAAVSAAARKNGATGNPDFVAGVRGLKSIEKEIAIHMSGKRAEDDVAHSLTFVDRPFFRDFRNVYVADQETETEIDNVILTNNGIIVVEVKSAKHNITIGEDGRLLYSNSESYHNESIGDKMSAKRRLLKARIESKLRERGLAIPVHIDSYLVFVTPKRLEVTITDNFRQEHWCRRGKLQHIVNNFISDVTYTAEEYAQLEEIIGNLDCNIRRFPTELDLPAIRDSFVALYDLVVEKPVINEVKAPVTPKQTQVRKTAPATQKRPAHRWNAFNIAASAAVVLVASVAAVTAAVRSAS